MHDNEEHLWQSLADQVETLTPKLPRVTASRLESMVTARRDTVSAVQQVLELHRDDQDPATLRRQNMAYGPTALLLCTVTALGFSSAIFWRVHAGLWVRDPVGFREKVVLPGHSAILDLHALTGCLWILMVVLQVLSGVCPATFWPRWRPRAMHSFIGRRANLVAFPFFLFCGWTVVCGCSHEVNSGYNSSFVRFVQVCALLLSMVSYFMGMIQVKRGLTAIHKDCMVTAVLYSTVPVGVPRAARDLVQMFLGPSCEVASTPETWFFLCSVYCLAGWPFVFIAAKRFRRYRGLLFFHIWIVIIACFLCRPSLAFPDCLVSAVLGDSHVAT